MRQAPELEFRWTWRPSQQRVLEAIQRHLRDRKLHVVAAPGAGKTTLGLEFFRLLGKPAVVLAPTLTIRDQWIMRLEAFLPAGAGRPGWVSTDLDEPAYFNSVTYQALHTRYREEQEEEEEEREDFERAPSGDALKRVTERFRAAGVGTLILDEAHHLRQEWWKALSKIADDLPELVLVSLTATPPYDVIGPQWQRYEELCGPIDEEISVPELVRAGTLCPHQDYVWALAPAKDDAAAVRAYDLSVNRLTRDLLSDPVLLRGIQEHPWIKLSAPDPAEVLEHPEWAFAMLVYLNGRGIRLPEPLLEVLDVNAEDLPRPSRRWWQLLVREVLFGKGWVRDAELNEHRQTLAKRLRADDLLWRRELRLEASRPVMRKLTLTPAKIEACVEVHRLERATRGEALRQVILTDFIRDDDVGQVMPATPQLGAWPIFRAIARATELEDVPHLALLTGRLSVLHEQRLDELRDALGEAAPALSAEPLQGLVGFVRVTLRGRDRFVGPFTRLLERGAIQTLVGTRALLGEGWDAPCINSLLLASYVGSFMLTNQMRGRAIRVDKEQPKKASSIWHLVAVEPGSESGTADLEALERRFTTFVGLSANKPEIRSGLERMALPPLRHATGRDAVNEEMKERLAAHTELHRRWTEAVEAGELQRVLPSVDARPPPPFKGFWFRRTLRYLIYCIVQAFLAGFTFVGEAVGGVQFKDLSMFLWVLVVACGVGLLFCFPKFVRAAWILARHLPVDGSVRQIALALRNAMLDTDLIETRRGRLGLKVAPQADGGILVALTGATFYEKSRFADALGEMLFPIQNPRYLIVRKGRWRKRRDYHAVPQMLGVRKERAQILHEAWERRLGPSDLVYTRTPEGRALLLKARARAFSAAMARPSERHDRWM